MGVRVPLLPLANGSGLKLILSVLGLTSVLALTSAETVELTSPDMAVVNDAG